MLFTVLAANADGLLAPSSVPIKAPLLCKPLQNIGIHGGAERRRCGRSPVLLLETTDKARESAKPGRGDTDPIPPPSPGPFPPLLILLLVPLAWGTYGPAVKSIYALEAPPPELAFNWLNYIVSSSTLAAISQLRKPGVTDPTSVDSSGASDATEESNRASILAGLELGGYLFLGSTVQIFGMRYTTAGRAAFIVQLTTVLVPLLDAFLSRRMPNRNALGGCALAFLGVSVLLTDGGGDSLAFDLSAGPAAALAALLSSPTGIGDGLVGISALAYSLHVVRLSYHAPRLDPILLARAKEVARLAFATLVLAVGVSVSASQGDALLAFAASFRDAPSDAALAMSIVVWNGLVTTAFPTWAQSYGQRAVSAGTAQVMYTSQPLWSSLFGFLVLGETFSQQGAMGAFLVFSAVLLVATAESATPIESTEEASSVD